MAAIDPITAVANLGASMFDAFGDVANAISNYFIAKEQADAMEYMADRQLDMQKEVTRRTQLLTQNIEKIVIVFFAGSAIVATIKAKSLTPVFALAGLLLLYIAYLKYAKPMK